MSLINQVLRDLDRQRGSADRIQFAALQGIGLVNPRRRSFLSPPTMTGVLGVLVTGVLLFQAGNHWLAASRLAADSELFTRRPETVLPEPTDTHVAAAITDDTVPVLPAAVPEPAITVVSVTEPEKATRAFPRGSDNVAHPESAPAPVTRPVKTLSRWQRTENAYAAGLRALQENDIRTAREQFLTTLELAPGHTPARLQLAAVYLDEDAGNQAEYLLQQGLQRDPADAPLARLYAQILSARGELELAREVLAPAASGGDANADTLALRAAINAQLGQYQAAENDYRLALQHDPHQANWWLGMGLALEQQGHAAGALQAYRTAISLPASDNVRAFLEQRIQLLQPAQTAKRG